MLSEGKREQARDIAKKFATAHQKFATTFLAHFESANADDVSIENCWHLETQAALWACAKIKLQTIFMLDEVREEALHSFQETMVPYWKQQCASEREAAAEIAEHSSKFLQLCLPGHATATARRMVIKLMLIAGVAPDSRPDVARLLTALLASHMLSDWRRLHGATSNECSR